MIPNIFDKNKPLSPEASGSVPIPDPFEAQYNRSLQNEAGVERGIQKENQKDIVAKQVAMFQKIEEEQARKKQLEGKVLFEEMSKELNPLSIQNLNKVFTTVGMEPLPEKIEGPKIGEMFLPTGQVHPAFTAEITEELGRDAREFVKGLPAFIESLSNLTPSRQGEMVAGTVVPPPRYKSVMEPEGYRPKGKRVKKITGYFQSQLEGVKNVAGLMAWLPMNVAEFSRNPAAYVKEKPLDTMFLMSAVGHVAKGKSPNLTPREATRADMPYRNLAETKPLMQSIERPQAETLSLEHQIKQSEGQLPSIERMPLIYREMDMDSLFEMAPQVSADSPSSPIVYFSSNKDLALGQRGNKGVLVEFENTFGAKPRYVTPGHEFVQSIGGGSELVARVQPSQMKKNIRSVTIKEGARGSRGESIATHRWLNGLVDSGGWEKTKNSDGSVTYRNKNPDAKPTTLSMPIDRPTAEMTADSMQIPEAMEYKYSGFDPIEYFKHGRHLIGEYLKKAVSAAPVHKISNGTTEVFSNEVAPFIEGSIKDLNFGGFKAQRMWNKNTTPAIYIFDKVPPLKKALYRPWQVGEKASYDMTMHTRQKVVPGWQKMLLDEGSSVPKARERIAGMLIDGQKNGPEILKHMGRDDLIGLKPTPAEGKIIKEARAWYDFYFESINKSREGAGMSKVKYVDDYFTFMRDLADLKEMGRGYEDMSSLVPSDIKLKGVPFRYQKTRKGSIGKVSLDFFEVFGKYAERAHKAIEITPVIGKGRAMLERMTFDAGQLNPKTGKPVKSRWQMKYTHPETAEWMSAWLNRIAEAPTPTPAYFKPVENMFAKLNKNASFAILSGNVRSALIQPTALRLAYVELGERYFVDGFGKVFNKGQRDFAMKNSAVLAPRSFDIHAQSILERKGGIGPIDRMRQYAGEKGMKPLQQLDQWTAEAAWLGAYEKGAKALKLEHADAVQYADDIVTKTQASAKTGDIAPIQAHTMGKVASMFQTFVINEWNQTLKNVVGIGGEKMTGAQRAKNIGRLAFSTAVINAVFEGGLNVRSPLPAPEWALKEAIESDTKWNDALLNILKELAEPIPIVGGSIRYSTPYRQAGPPALQIMGDAKNAIDSLISKGEFGPAQLDAFGKLLGIPGTSQIIKTARRLNKGHSLTGSILGVKSDKNINLKKKDSTDPYNIW